MAAAATAVKLHLRVSRLQEAAVVLQEKAWVQEAVGEVAKRGRFVLDAISTRSVAHHVPPAGAAFLGSSGLLLPSRPTKSAGINPNDPLEDSLVANLAAPGEYGSSKVTFVQFVHAKKTAAAATSDGQAVSYGATTEWRSPLVQSTEEEDYGWETDPNGGWLASFP
ncbi:unnamed protein product [Calypogeia fissa]